MNPKKEKSRSWFSIVLGGGLIAALLSFLLPKFWPDNQQPVADIAVDQRAGTIPFTAHFDGSGSFDPEGKNLDYEWRISRKLVSRNQNFTHEFREAGVYNVTLSVTDGSLAAKSTQVIVAESSPGNEAEDSPKEKSKPQEKDPSLASGPGYALKFDGKDDYVRINSQECFDFRSAMTIETWIRSASGKIEGVRGLVSGLLSNQTDPNGWLLVFGVSFWGFSARVPSQARAISESKFITSEKWHHLAGTYDGSHISIYLDGQLMHQERHPGQNIINVDYILIGSYSLDKDSSFRGDLDELRIWSVARTQAQIRASMNKSLNPSTTGLVGYWRFDEERGQLAVDSTGNHNNGLLGQDRLADHKDPKKIKSDAPIR